MTIAWKCKCGWRGEDGYDSFLHRDGTPNHNPEPYIRRDPSGIEKESVIDISKAGARG